MDLIYYITRLIFRIALNIYFRDVTVIGLENFPKKGPVIVCVNHSSLFVDGMLLTSTVRRQTSFLLAAITLRKPILRQIGLATKCVPVERPQDVSKKGIGQIISISNDTVMGLNTNFTQFRPGDMILVKEISDEMVISKIINDTELKLTVPLAQETQNMKLSYKVLPKLDQSKLYESVWNALKNNAFIGILPEGVSHDKTELIPLKAGVAIIALGAAERCKEPITIIPCGLNYFQSHRFRGKVVVEYGKPYVIPNEFNDLYNKDKKEGISKFLQEIEKKMKDVKIEIPSYRELSAIYLARSLYVPDDYKLYEKDMFIFHKKLAEAYCKFKDYPEVNKLFDSIQEYKSKIKSLGIQDSQVRKLGLGFIGNFLRILYSFMMMLLYGIFAFPGILINGPIALIMQFIGEKERKKAIGANKFRIKGFDVSASYKVIYSIVAYPLALFFWTYGFGVLLTSVTDLDKETITILTIIFFFVWPVYSYVMIKASDEFVRHFQNFKGSLVFFIFKDKIISLKQTRLNLKEKVRQFVDKHGAEFLSDSEKNRILSNAAYAKESTLLDKVLGILQEIRHYISKFIWQSNMKL